MESIEEENRYTCHVCGHSMERYTRICEVCGSIRRPDKVHGEKVPGRTKPYVKDSCRRCGVAVPAGKQYCRDCGEYVERKRRAGRKPGLFARIVRFVRSLFGQGREKGPG